MPARPHAWADDDPTARPWSTRCSVCSLTISRPSSNNDMQPCAGPLQVRDALGDSLAISYVLRQFEALQSKLLRP